MLSALPLLKASLQPRSAACSPPPKAASPSNALSHRTRDRQSASECAAACDSERALAAGRFEHPPHDAPRGREVLKGRLATPTIGQRGPKHGSKLPTAASVRRDVTGEPSSPPRRRPSKRFACGSRTHGHSLAGGARYGHPSERLARTHQAGHHRQALSRVAPGRGAGAAMKASRMPGRDVSGRSSVMDETRGRLEVPVQHEGIEVGSVGPGDGPQLVVHTHLREVVGIGQRLEHGAMQLPGEIDVACAAIAEVKPELVVTKHVYRGDAYELHASSYGNGSMGSGEPPSFPLPVGFQLMAVKTRPLGGKSEADLASTARRTRSNRPRLQIGPIVQDPFVVRF